MENAVQKQCKTGGSILDNSPHPDGLWNALRVFNKRWYLV